MVQFSATTTLTLPLKQSGAGHNRAANKLTCFDPASATAGTATSHQLPTLAAPPQFADSPPDEVKHCLKSKV